MTPSAAVAGASAATDGFRDGFSVSPAALSGAAGVFDAEADQIADVVATLTAQLDSLGACWGADAVGTRFGTAYQQAGLAVLDNVRALGVGTIRIAAALRAVSRAYELVDQPVPGLPGRDREPPVTTLPVLPGPIVTLPVYPEPDYVTLPVDPEPDDVTLPVYPEPRPEPPAWRGSDPRDPRNPNVGNPNVAEP